MKTFFRLLRKTPRRWRVRKDGSIRLNYGKQSCCPITAIPKAMMGIYVSIDETSVAAPLLGLDEVERQELLNAADYRSTEHQELRQRLLEACGLRGER